MPLFKVNKSYQKLAMRQIRNEVSLQLRRRNEIPLQGRSLISSRVLAVVRAYPIFSPSFLMRVLSVVGLMPSNSAAPPRP